MSKLSNIAKKWDNIEESSAFPKLEVGAYVVKIDDVENFDDKEGLKVFFDINEGELKGEFERQHKIFGPEWPYDATQWVSYREAALGFFKRFITSVERSNNDYNFKETNGDLVKLKNKLVVAVFGLSEIPVPDVNNNNKPRIGVKFREWRSIEALKNGKIEIPADVKKLSSDYDLNKYEEALGELNHEPQSTTKETYVASAADIITDEDLPF